VSDPQRLGDLLPVVVADLARGRNLSPTVVALLVEALEDRTNETEENR
jgi:hypothetical protein